MTCSPLECCEGALLAHPGTPAAGVAHAEAARLGDGARCQRACWRSTSASG